MLIITKTVEWSYPTSENAKRFNMPKGCFTVSLNEPSKGHDSITARALAGFATRPEALSYARTLSNPWSIHFAKIYPQDAKA